MSRYNVIFRFINIDEDNVYHYVGDDISYVVVHDATVLKMMQEESKFFNKLKIKMDCYHSDVRHRTGTLQFVVNLYFNNFDATRMMNIISDFTLKMTKIVEEDKNRKSLSAKAILFNHSLDYIIHDSLSDQTKQEIAATLIEFPHRYQSTYQEKELDYIATHHERHGTDYEDGNYIIMPYVNFDGTGDAFSVKISQSKENHDNLKYPRFRLGVILIGTIEFDKLATDVLIDVIKDQIDPTVTYLKMKSEGAIDSKLIN